MLQIGKDISGQVSLLDDNGTQGYLVSIGQIRVYDTPMHSPLARHHVLMLCLPSCGTYRFISTLARAKVDIMGRSKVVAQRGRGC